MRMPPSIMTVWVSLVVVAVAMMSVTSRVEAKGVTPIVYSFGDNFKIGYEMGETMRHLANDAIKRHKGLREVLLPFNKTSEGKALYTRLLEASKKHYPEVLEELQGLAEGAGVDFGKLFLMHIEPEVNILQAPKKKDFEPPRPSGGCTNFFVRNEEWALHVHSEDSAPEIRFLGSIWMAEKPDERYRITESFVAYAYPGMLPGNAWYINSHGLMGTGNIVFQRHPPPTGAVPRRIIGRALMGATSIEDLTTKLREAPPIGSGFNFMLSERVCEEAKPECVSMTGVEITTDKAGVNQLHIRKTESFDWHFNEYRYLEVDQTLEDSTRWRRHRLGEYSRTLGRDPKTMEEIKDIMSDDQNRKFPFYRDGAPPDYLATTSIAMADHYKRQLYIYNGKPNQEKPEVVLDMQPWHGKRLNMDKIIVESRKSWEDHVRDRDEL